MRFSRVLLVFLLALAAVAIKGDGGPVAVTNASPGAVTLREPAFGLPHIYASTDLELAREVGREVAKDRLGQLILGSRVARGTLFQAFALLDPSTFDADLLIRKEGYTSSELNNMYAKLPADVQALIMEYARGVNDTIDAIYAGTLPKPLEVSLLQGFGLSNDLFGNATNISDQVDPHYKAPGGADPEHPNGGFQFTPELAIAIGVQGVRTFGAAGVDEASLLSQLNSLTAKFPTTGSDIWADLNFLNDPLAPVSVPDPSTPGFGGPLAREAPASDLAAFARKFPDYDYAPALQQLRKRHAHREALARRLGAWPSLGSYAWMIDGQRSATANPWVGGFPQTGIQTPSIMHFLEMRSAQGTDHRVQAMGMAFVGAPLVLIGQTDNVAYTSTTAALKNVDFYLDKLILEKTDALRYNDEGTPAAVNKRTEQIRSTGGSPTAIAVWRTHARAGNGGSRTVDAFQGNASGAVDSATATSLTDTAAFAGDYAGGFVALTDGAGAGQMRPILSSTADTLTLAPADAWTTTPNTTSRYVAVKPGNDLVAVSREQAFWLEESTTALGFSLMQRAEGVLDIRRGARLMPSSHNFLAADNRAFNGIGTDLGTGAGNTSYWSSGFWRLPQGLPPADPRLPFDGTAPNPLVVVGGSVGSAAASTLTSSGAFTAKDFSPPPFNFRLNNPSLKGSEFVVTITGGAGYKQTRRIAGNTADTLTLEEPWGVVPSPGDLFEVYEVLGMPEAINPPQGYTANWNNKAATADDGPFGRQHRSISILERLAADSSWTRQDQRQLNKDVAGLDGKGNFGRYLIPRLRQAVDGVGNGGNPQVDTVLAALETHNGAPFLGRYFIDPLTASTMKGEVAFLNSLIARLSSAIYGDELSGTTMAPPGGATGLDVVQHAIDSAAATPAGRYAQEFAGDYFNGVDWRVVVRDALAATIGDLGGIPADSPRGNDTFAHPLSALYPQLVFDPTPTGNRGVWEQIVEAGPVVNGEFIFPLGQTAFVNTAGNPDPRADALHPVWRDWRFVPMLHIAQDLALDPDGDVDNDGVADGFERWYFGSNSPPASDDADGDRASLLTEYLNGADPTTPDSDGDLAPDGADLPICGGHPLDSRVQPERLDGAHAGVDDDGDTQIDEALPNGSDTADCDGDGFKGSAEKYVFSAADTSDDQRACGNSWPPDMAPATLDHVVNIVDVGAMRPVFNTDNVQGSTPPHTHNHAGYSARKDLTADGFVNIIDIGAIRPFFNKSCSP